MYARSRFAILTGAAPAAVTVVLADTSVFNGEIDDSGLSFTWYSARSLERLRRIGTGVDEFAMPHEISHFLLFAEVKRPDPETGYATALPDWFDEAVAIWAETEQNRAYRLAGAGGLPDSLFDPMVLQRTRHPIHGRDPEHPTSTRTETESRCPPTGCRLPPGMSIRTRVFADGRVVRDTVPTSSLGDAGLPGDWFYLLSYSLIAYIHSHGGTDAVAELMRRFDGGWPKTDVFSGLPHLPGDLTSFRREWMKWVRTRNPGEAY